MEINQRKTVLQELFIQLKLQLGNNKVSQMFDEVYWLAKEQEHIEKAFDLGVQSGMTKGSKNVGKDYYQSKYGGQHD